MTGPRYQVIVAGADSSTVDALATTLRDDGTVRTAYSVEALFETLGDEVDVVLVDPDLTDEGLDSVLTELQTRAPACQIGLLDPDVADGLFEIPPTRTPGKLRSIADAAVGPDPVAVRDAVRQLASRARYRRHLDEYYGLAEERAAHSLAEDEPEADVAGLESQIDRLRRALDAEFETIGDSSVFDAALSGTERTLDASDGDDTESAASDAGNEGKE